MIDARIAAHFRQVMQRRMPDGWKIAVNFECQGEHHQLTGYAITTEAGQVVHLGPNGETVNVPEGWSITYQDRQFMSEIHITAPSGVSLMLDDGYLA